MPRRKPKHTLLSAGASLIGMGLIFLLLPAMLGTRPVMKAVGEGLRMPGWFALGVGVALLALHWLVRQRSGKLGSDEDYSSHLGQQQSFLRVCPRSSLQDNAAQGDCLPRRMMRWPVYFL